MTFRGANSEGQLDVDLDLEPKPILSVKITMSSDTSRSKEAKPEGSQAETAAKPALMDRLAPWLRPSLTRRTFKTFARCLLVLLAALVLMLAQKSLVAMGQAAFFAWVWILTLYWSIGLPD